MAARLGPFTCCYDGRGTPQGHNDVIAAVSDPPRRSGKVPHLLDGASPVPVFAAPCRSYARGDAFPACRVGSLAPVSSTNDSEVSSDALTDDSMSLTDGSV